MRIKIYLELKNPFLDFDHQEPLVSFLHKALGSNNDYHDVSSCYVISDLQGGVKAKLTSEEGDIIFKLNYEQGAYWYISSWDDDILANVISYATRNPDINDNISISEIDIVQPSYNLEKPFIMAQPIKLITPILLKQNHPEHDDRIEHVTYKNPDRCNYLLNKSVVNKIKTLGLDYPVDGFDFNFDYNYRGSKIKLKSYKNIKNKVNFCPLIYSGPSEILNLVWLTGIGNSTGIGFGMIQ